MRLVPRPGCLSDGAKVERRRFLRMRQDDALRLMGHAFRKRVSLKKKGGNPIEVMGLMLGRPDPDTPKTLVVTDVFPLPIEGFETRVIADDQDVVNYMIELGESLEVSERSLVLSSYA